MPDGFWLFVAGSGLLLGAATSPKLTKLHEIVAVAAAALSIGFIVVGIGRMVYMAYGNTGLLWTAGICISAAAAALFWFKTMNKVSLDCEG